MEFLSSFYHKVNFFGGTKYKKEQLFCQINKAHLELVSKELNLFGVIAGLFRQIGGHSSRQEIKAFGLFF